MALFETSFIETPQWAQTFLPEPGREAFTDELWLLTYAATQPTLITGSGQVQLCWRDKGQRHRERRVTQRVEGAAEGKKIQMKWKFIWERLQGRARRATAEILMQSTALLQPVWDSRGSLEWHWWGPSANLPVDPHKSCTCSWLYPGVPPLYKHITCSSAHAEYMRHYGA